MARSLVHRLSIAFFAIAASFAACTAHAAPHAFHATIGFTEQVMPAQTAAPCFLVGTIAGSGIAGGLGSVTLASTDCINPLPPAFMSFAFASHHVVLTASDGSQLFATYGGILSSDGSITGSYVIYGGTGRYAHAAGAGVIRGAEYIDLDTGAGAGQITLSGVLAY